MMFIWRKNDIHYSIYHIMVHIQLAVAQRGTRAALLEGTLSPKLFKRPSSLGASGCVVAVRGAIT
jgi:hypothetical protein